MPMTDLIEQYLQAYPKAQALQADLAQLSCTEAGHPRTQNFAHLTESSEEAALALCASIDEACLQEVLTQDEMLADLKAWLNHALTHCRCLYLVGAGASGRMVLLLERMVAYLCPEKVGCVKAVLAGGDVALMHALPSFEDQFELGKLQLQKAGFDAKRDAVLAFSVSARAKFAWATLEGAEHAALMTSQPRSIVTHWANQFQQVLPKCFHVMSDPPVIAGSTRMQPTTAMMLAMTALFACLGVDIDVETVVAEALVLLKATSNLALAALLCDEFDALEQGQAVAYAIKAQSEHIGLYGLSLLTDTTERAPTFNLPKMRPHTALTSAEVFPFALSLDCDQALQALYGRAPQALAMPDYPETSLAYLHAYDFSRNQYAKWQQAYQDCGYPLKAYQYSLSLNDFVVEQEGRKWAVLVNAPTTHIWSYQIWLKMMLNSYSSTLMAKRGYCAGNRMTHLSVSNLKLLHRAECLMQVIAKEQNCHASDENLRQALFQALKAIKPNQSVLHEALKVVT